MIFWLLFILVILSSIQARTMMNDAVRSRPVPVSGPGSFPISFDPSPYLQIAATFVPGAILVVFGLFTIASCRQTIPKLPCRASLNW